MITAISLVAALLGVLSTLCNQAQSHSFLLNPRGDFKTFRKPECRIGGPEHAPNDSCVGPCFRTDDWLYNTYAGVTPYQRGQIVSMVWARNQHRGGFVRFSLVPRHLRMEYEAHKKMTFRYACFESGQHWCNLENCGTDSWLYRTDVEIPTSYPDGLYVLGWSWSGGVWDDGSYFGDYYSCSYVKISGGPFTNSYAPVFITGENIPNKHTCHSTVDRLGVCVREPCMGHKAKHIKPFPFSQNRKPPSILASWMPGYNAQETPTVVPSPSYSSTPVPTESATPTKTTEPTESPSPKVQTRRKNFPTIIGLRMINVDSKGTFAKLVSNSSINVPKRVIRFTVAAIVKGPILSVTFFIDNMKTKTEMERPYTLWGDYNGKYNAWKNPPFGTWTKIKLVVIGRDQRQYVREFSILLVRQTE